MRLRRIAEPAIGEPEAEVPVPASVGPEVAGPEQLRSLNHRAGNGAVNALLAAAQPKLEVGAAGDPAERDADATARAVVATLSGRRLADAPSSDPASPPVRRRAVIGAEGGMLDADTERAVRASGPGQPLAPRARDDMSAAFGADLSGVRLHAGGPATALNEQLSARAFTVGQDVFFRDGIPDASGGAGQELLAHELAHTVQQRTGGSAARRVHRRYVETDTDPQGHIDTDGGPVGYRWMPEVDPATLEVSPVATGWRIYSLYRRRTSGGPPAPVASTAPETTAPAVDPIPPTPATLTPDETRRLTALQERLAAWVEINQHADKHTRDGRRNAAKRVKRALASPGALAVDELEREVESLAAGFARARREAEARRADKERAAAEEAEAAAAQLAFEQTQEVLSRWCSNSSQLGILRRAFSDVQLVAILDHVGPTELVTVSQKLPTGLVVDRLAAAPDSGPTLLAAAKNVARRDDVAALTVGPPALADAVLVGLLGEMSSTTLLTLLPLAGSAEVLRRMRASAADDAELATTLRDLRAAGWKPDQALTAANDVDPAVFSQDLADQKVDMGLVADNGTAIAWMSSTHIVGDGEANEQRAVADALAELDAGHGHVANVCEDRGPHENRRGRLPGARNVVPYQEYGIHPPTAHWPGARRLVVDNSVPEPAQRRVYYSWTHYGDNGSPAFVRIR